MTMTYQDRQRAQLQRFLDWQQEEGDTEGPTLLPTLLQPRQQERLAWVRQQKRGRTLEVGCNWGYSTAVIGADAAIDINPANIALACILVPGVDFRCADAVHLPFGDKSFDTVCLPDMLEHLDWVDGVPRAIDEAKRVARERILITLPDGREDTKDALCFKHRWLADAEHVEEMLNTLLPFMAGAYVQNGFILMGANAYHD